MNNIVFCLVWFVMFHVYLRSTGYQVMCHSCVICKYSVMFNKNHAIEEGKGDKVLKQYWNRRDKKCELLSCVFMLLTFYFGHFCLYKIVKFYKICYLLHMAAVIFSCLNFCKSGPFWIADDCILGGSNETSLGILLGVVVEFVEK